MENNSGLNQHVFKPLQGRRIIFGVSGGIAAYKAAEYCRNLAKLGAQVRVILTENGTKFVSPLTFSTLTGQQALTSIFHNDLTHPIPHIELAKWAELLVILPATANIIGKTACGIADDLLTTLFLAFKGKKLLFPSMNPVMFENPAVQENISKLRERGVTVAEPEEGTVACGDTGKGRLPDFESVLFLIRKGLASHDLKGLNVLVTSGPTREPIDPVRFISNRSSGKMGLALATVASLRGARAHLISGPTCLRLPSHLPVVRVETAKEMAEHVLLEAKAMDVVIMAAAVADYTPVSYVDTKIKKTGQKLVLELQRTQDILFELGKAKRPGQILVGFCAETENLIENAFKKLQKKNLDLIVANDVTTPGAGFDWDTNKVFIIDSEENVEELPLLHKEEVAERIFDRIRQLSLKT